MEHNEQWLRQRAEGQPGYSNAYVGIERRARAIGDMGRIVGGRENEPNGTRWAREDAHAIQFVQDWEVEIAVDAINRSSALNRGYATEIEKHAPLIETVKKSVKSPAAIRDARHREMADADRVFQRELVRVYGEKSAGDARYKLKHDDAAVQAAGKAFTTASQAWHDAVRAAREESPRQASVVERLGPLYHGTIAVFDKFDPTRAGRGVGWNDQGRGIYLTTDGVGFGRYFAREAVNNTIGTHDENGDGVVLNVAIEPSAKILDLNTDVFEPATSRSLLKTMGLRQDTIASIAEADLRSPERVLMHWLPHAPQRYELSGIVQAMGYDGIVRTETRLPDGNYIADGARSVVVYDFSKVVVQGQALDLPPVPPMPMRAGDFVGKIVNVDDAMVAQRVGRDGKTVHHLKANLSRDVQVGEVAEISYHNGRAEVKAPHGHDRSVAR